jgi:hypothetical protein
MQARKVHRHIHLIPVEYLKENVPHFSYHCIQAEMLIVYRSSIDNALHLGRVIKATHVIGGDIIYCKVHHLFSRYRPGESTEECIKQEQIERIVTKATR